MRRIYLYGLLSAGVGIADSAAAQSGSVGDLIASALVTLSIAMMEDPTTHEVYFWEILIPGMIVGIIVGFATQKYGKFAPAK